MQRYDLQADRLGERIAEMEALNRTRALTDAESSRLEAMIRRQSRSLYLHHAQLRAAKRDARTARQAA